MDRLTAQGKTFGIAAAAMYVDRCTIMRPSSTIGPHGGRIPGAPTVLAADVPCRTSPASASERQLAGATQGETALKIRMPAWQDDQLVEVDATCEIIIAARGGIPAQTLKVVAPLPNQGLTLEVIGTMKA